MDKKEIKNKIEKLKKTSENFSGKELKEMLVYISELELLLAEDDIEEFTETAKETKSGLNKKCVTEIAGIKICTINGDYRRSKKQKIEFTMGGHYYVYNDIPEDEIWIDENLIHKPKDMMATVLHEMTERNLMKEAGMTYDDSHEIANVVEQRYRETDKVDTWDEIEKISKNAIDEAKKNQEKEEAKSGEPQKQVYNSETYIDDYFKENEGKISKWDWSTHLNNLESNFRSVINKQFKYLRQQAVIDADDDFYYWKGKPESTAQGISSEPIVKPSYEQALNNFIRLLTEREIKESASQNFGEENKGKPYYQFKVEKGKKYDRILAVSGFGKGQSSAYAFINKETGGIMKPAGWKAPEPRHYERGNIYNINPLEGTTRYGVVYMEEGGEVNAISVSDIVYDKNYGGGIEFTPKGIVRELDNERNQVLIDHYKDEIITHSSWENSRNLNKIKLLFQKHPSEYNIYTVVAETKNQLCRIFVRAQAFYESDKFKNKVFTLDVFKKWYSGDGEFTYYDDWYGFNIPDYSIEKFIDGRFEPLSVEERWLSENIKATVDTSKPFYIAGYAQGYNNTMRHELSHALYYLSSEYKSEVDKIIKSIPKHELGTLVKFLEVRNYSKSVFPDEMQAYIMADKKFLIERNGWVDAYQPYSDKLNVIFDKYMDEQFSAGGNIYDRGSRPSPRESATLYPAGYEMQGQDGRMYHVIVNSRNVHQWKPLSGAAAYKPAQVVEEPEPEKEATIETINKDNFFINTTAVFEKVIDKNVLKLLSEKEPDYISKYLKGIKRYLYNDITNNDFRYDKNGNVIGYEYNNEYYILSEKNDDEGYYYFKNTNSKISSKYWYTTEGVYRESDHWGGEIGTCIWWLTGDTSIYDDTVTGFCRWDKFRRIPSVEERFTQQQQDGMEFYGGGNIYDRGSRPSPRESATLYPAGYEMRGQDGRMYHVIVNSRNVHQWKPLSGAAAYKPAPVVEEPEPEKETTMETGKVSMKKENLQDSFGWDRVIYRVGINEINFGYIYPTKFFDSSAVLGIKKWGFAEQNDGRIFFGNTKYFDTIDEAQDWVYEQYKYKFGAEEEPEPPTPDSALPTQDSQLLTKIENLKKTLPLFKGKELKELKQYISDLELLAQETAEEPKEKESWEMTKDEVKIYLDKQARQGTTSKLFDNWNKEGTYEYAIPETIKFGDDYYKWAVHQGKHLRGTQMSFGNPYISVAKTTNMKLPKSSTGEVSGVEHLDEFTVGGEGLKKQHANKIINIIRKDQIKKALAAGKPVPQQVLNEYPELVPEPVQQTQEPERVCETGQTEIHYSKIVNNKQYQTSERVILAFDNAKALKDYCDTIDRSKASMVQAETKAKYSFFIPKWHHGKDGKQLWFNYNEKSDCPYEFITIDSKDIDATDTTHPEVSTNIETAIAEISQLYDFSTEAGEFLYTHAKNLVKEIENDSEHHDVSYHDMEFDMKYYDAAKELDFNPKFSKRSPILTVADVDEDDKDEGVYQKWSFSIADIDAVKDFITAVNTRLETRKAVAQGTDLFPETANIPEYQKRALGGAVALTPESKVLIQIMLNDIMYNEEKVKEPQDIIAELLIRPYAEMITSDDGKQIVCDPLFVACYDCIIGAEIQLHYSKVWQMDMNYTYPDNRKIFIENHKKLIAFLEEKFPYETNKLLKNIKLN